MKILRKVANVWVICLYLFRVKGMVDIVATVDG